MCMVLQTLSASCCRVAVVPPRTAVTFLVHHLPSNITNSLLQSNSATLLQACVDLLASGLCHAHTHPLILAVSTSYTVAACISDMQSCLQAHSAELGRMQERLAVSDVRVAALTTHQQQEASAAAAKSQVKPASCSACAAICMFTLHAFLEFISSSL